MGRKLTPKRPKAERAKAVDWRPGFAAALAVTGCVSSACDAAGVSRTAAYRTREAEAAFAAAWGDALARAADALKSEARRRAVEGVTKLVTHQGVPVFVWTLPDGSVVPEEKAGAALRPLYEHAYSDGLLTTLLKAALPAEFRDNHRVEHAGDPRAPVRVAGELTPAELQALDDDALARQIVELRARVDPA